MLCDHTHTTGHPSAGIFIPNPSSCIMLIEQAACQSSGGKRRLRIVVLCCVAQGADAGGEAARLASPLQSTYYKSLVESGWGPGRCLINGYGLTSREWR